jgi:hypothetical protein
VDVEEKSSLRGRVIKRLFGFLDRGMSAVELQMLGDEALGCGTWRWREKSRQKPWCNELLNVPDVPLNCCGTVETCRCDCGVYTHSILCCRRLLRDSRRRKRLKDQCSILGEEQFPIASEVRARRQQRPDVFSPARCLLRSPTKRRQTVLAGQELSGGVRLWVGAKAISPPDLTAAASQF